MATASAATSSRPDCAFCRKEILPDASISKLNCNHEYHGDCLQAWLASHHNTCPLDEGRITSINGIAIERAYEQESYLHAIKVRNSLIAARPLEQLSVRVIEHPSIHSADPVERQAAKVPSFSYLKSKASGANPFCQSRSK